MNPPGYGANNHDIGTALSLAQYRGDKIGAATLERELRASQEQCSTHVPNPEHPERCYKCGASPIVERKAGPGPAKIRSKPLDISRRIA